MNTEMKAVGLKRCMKYTLTPASISGVNIGIVRGGALLWKGVEGLRNVSARLRAAERVYAVVKNVITEQKNGN